MLNSNYAVSCYNAVDGKHVIAECNMYCAGKLYSESHKHIFLLHIDFPQVNVNRHQIGYKTLIHGIISMNLKQNMLW